MTPLLLTCLASVCVADEPNSRSPDNALARGLAFLSREVPRWSRENKCFSCHNNGDGARSLYRAIQQGRQVDPQSLAETNTLLAQPARWQDNGTDEEFSDKKLQSIQFAGALAAAVKAGVLRQQQPLLEAAELLSQDQQPDGSWQLDSTAAIGSPVTYGPLLCTVRARQVLEQADRRKFSNAIEKADRWLLVQRPRTVYDSAALLLGLAGRTEAKWQSQRKSSLALVRRAAAQTGGWGPYELSRPEPFDTAVVLLALAGNAGDDATNGELISAGRRYLTQAQLDDGSWPETTRPAGAQSYAQRMSTAAWCVEALLITTPRGSADEVSK